MKQDFCHIIVCPPEKTLISKLKEFNVILYFNNSFDFSNLASLKEKLGEKLRGIIVDYDNNLDTIDYQDFDATIPIIIFGKQLGNLTTFGKKIPEIRNLNIRYFLSDDDENNFVSLCILSSLELNCGIYFENKNPYWEKMSNLFYYAAYGKVSHASIEPFYYIFQNYKSPLTKVDYDCVYFNDPRKFLYVNAEGQVSLTKLDFLNNKFICNISEIKNIGENRDYINKVNAWHSTFINKDKCSFCPYWNACLGKFSEKSGGEECISFFSNVFEFINLSKKE